MRFSRLGTAGIFLLFIVVTGGLVTGCNDEQGTQLVGSSTQCAPKSTPVVTGEVGTAYTFLPDPISSSMQKDLTPKSNQLDSFLASVKLMHLSGQGILKSKYVDVINGLDCQMSYGAYDSQNKFNYSHSDRRFQEAMTYYFSDTFQGELDQAGYLTVKSPIQLIAHCALEDNASYIRKTQMGGEYLNQVCLADSVETPGAFYSDDGQVVIHELQHANTVNAYSHTQDFNQIWYDEAGALNEAISDFMALAFSDEVNPPSFNLDPRIFSRWALGTFFTNQSHIRGAHQCPMYDPKYPNCDSFPSFGVSTSSTTNAHTISLVYPDGLGWPYNNYYSSSNPALDTYIYYLDQEEYHANGVLMEGALWDVYSVVKKNHQNDKVFARRAMSKLVMESIKHLPAANSSTNISPVNFIEFCNQMVTYSTQISDFTAADQASIKEALKARGLYQFPTLTTGDWLAVGAGTNYYLSQTTQPGVRIVDHPIVLKKWLAQMGGNPYMVTQTSAAGAESQIRAGDVAAVWFDLQNNSEVTAGGVLLTVTVDDPDVKILDSSTNIGYLSSSSQNQAQIIYGKVNGTGIVKALNPSGSPLAIPLGNTYFRTNPRFDQSWTTAIWIKVSSQAASGKVVRFQVTAKPSNGVASTQTFPIKIQ